MPFACTEDPAALSAAVARAPEPVVLEDGSTLSTCVQRAYRDAELQELGGVLTELAEDLSSRAAGGDLDAAGDLGYLSGAVRRGSRRTQGIQAELDRRVERAAFKLGRAPRAVQDAFYAGQREGRRTG